MAVFFFRENRFLGSNRSIRHFEAIDFDRPFETWSIFDATSDMGVSRALNRMEVFVCFENRYYCGRFDRFDYCEAIDFDRHFETWSILDETCSNFLV